MNDREKVDKTRRTLVAATTVVGGVATVGAAAPFVASMWPSERAKGAGAPVEAEIGTLQPGGFRAAGGAETPDPPAGEMGGFWGARKAGVGVPPLEGNARVAESGGPQPHRPG